MKKFFTSLTFVLAFIGYGLYQYFTNTTTMQYVADNSSTSQTTNNKTTITTTIQTTYNSVTKTTPTKTKATKSTKPTPTPTPVVTKPTGQYVDGTYVGSTANAYYGNVQVQATVTGGKLTDVTFLQYPNDRSTSRFINNQAMPSLQSEAIQAQSANVNGVSGASDTSAAFRESLASALSQAKS